MDRDRGGRGRRRRRAAVSPCSGRRSAAVDENRRRRSLCWPTAPGSGRYQSSGSLETRPGQGECPTAIRDEQLLIGPGRDCRSRLVPEQTDRAMDRVRVADKRGVEQVNDEDIDDGIVHLFRGDATRTAVAGELGQAGLTTTAAEQAEQLCPGGGQRLTRAPRHAGEPHVFQGGLEQADHVPPPPRRDAGCGGVEMLQAFANVPGVGSSKDRPSALAMVRSDEATSWRRRSGMVSSARMRWRGVARVGRPAGSEGVRDG